MREIRTLRSTWRGLETWHGTSLHRAPVLDPTCERAGVTDIRAADYDRVLIFSFCHKISVNRGEKMGGRSGLDPLGLREQQGTAPAQLEDVSGSTAEKSE